MAATARAALRRRIVLVEGHDKPTCGRGVLVFSAAGRVIGPFCIHNADDSGLVCESA